jgi:predicted TPR repeat methyltransferase
MCVGAMVGVDLSRKMIEVTRVKGCYDVALVEDVHSTLERFRDDSSLDVTHPHVRHDSLVNGEREGEGCLPADAEEAAWLRALPTLSLDLVLSADTFIYVGDLERCFALAAAKLKRGRGGGGGLFAFSVELLDEGDSGSSAGFRLLRSGRYAHRPSYIHSLAGKYEFKVVAEQRVVVRKEQADPIPGLIFLLERQGLEAPLAPAPVATPEPALAAGAGVGAGSSAPSCTDEVQPTPVSQCAGTGPSHQRCETGRRRRGARPPK